MRYNKQPLDHDELIHSLTERGLAIEDKARALRYLKNVGYYRLTGYMYHLQSNDGHHIVLTLVSIR